MLNNLSKCSEIWEQWLHSSDKIIMFLISIKFKAMEIKYNLNHAISLIS
jgi:hypothetical protein